MNISNAEFYFQKTGRHNLYNIMPIANIPSVIQHGLLCFDLAKRFHHKSVALNDVQERRENVTVDVADNLRLHQYANLYFTPKNPMMYYRKDEAEKLCVLVVLSSVLDIDGCVVTDRNAATDIVRFFSPDEGIDYIDFKKVFAKYWTHDDQLEYENHKAIKCAEVLIPYKIAYSNIVAAIVLNDESKQRIINMGFEKKIKVDPSIFYH